MNTKQLSILRNSWFLLLIRLPEIGSLFYQRFFEVAPEVKSLFSNTDAKSQEKKLVNMVTHVVTRLDRLDEVFASVQALAQKHAGYSVKAEHYEAVALALVWTLRRGLADHWDEEVEAAWTHAYALLAGAMLEFGKTAA